MARVTYNQPFNGFDINQAGNAAAVGTVTTATSNRIEFTDGAYTAGLNGVFIYTSNDLLGRVSGTTYAKDGVTYMTVTELNISLSGTIPTDFYSGNDTYIGSVGNDDFFAWLGDDRYDGGTGIDTVHYTAPKSDFSVKANGNGFTLTGLGKVDTLTNIERLAFDDGTLALDVGAGQNAGAAYRLYEAAFDRKADTAGLNYWTKELDAGKSLQQVANSFVDSAEFKALNPGSDPNSLINNFYLHVLDRQADAAGLQYWNEQMNAGLTASDVLVSFSESQENINNAAAELNNGVWLV